MSSLGLLLFLSWFVCGLLLEETTNAENYTSSGNLTENPTTPLIPEESTSPSPTSKPIQTTTTTTTTLYWLNLKECQEILVRGVLIVTCTFFLMITCLLTCKVCRLSRRIRALKRSVQPNGNSDFLEAKKDKSKSEGEDKEAAMLLSYVTQANQELDSAATEQDGEKAEEDGGKSEEKNESGSPTSEEALAAAENSTCSQPQE